MIVWYVHYDNIDSLVPFDRNPILRRQELIIVIGHTLSIENMFFSYLHKLFLQTLQSHADILVLTSKWPWTFIVLWHHDLLLWVIPFLITQYPMTSKLNSHLFHCKWWRHDLHIVVCYVVSDGVMTYTQSFLNCKWWRHELHSVVCYIVNGNVINYKLLSCFRPYKQVTCTPPVPVSCFGAGVYLRARLYNITSS